jgi:hypothetical protein
MEFKRISEAEKMEVQEVMEDFMNIVRINHGNL